MDGRTTQDRWTGTGRRIRHAWSFLAGDHRPAGSRPPKNFCGANALVQGAESAGDLFGPVLAAGLVALVGISGGLSAVTGLHLLAAIVLTAFGRRLVRTRRAASSAVVAEGRIRPGELGAGLRFAWGEPVVRTMLLVLAVLDVAVVGPVLVGGAVLAEQRRTASRVCG